MTAGFSVLAHKASRGPKLLVSGQSKEQAYVAADTAYGVSKQLNDLELVPSGLAFLLVTDATAQRILAQHTVHAQDAKDILFQWGGY